MGKDGRTRRRGPGDAPRLAALLLAVAALSPSPGRAEDSPATRRILILESFGRDISPVPQMGALLRTEIARAARVPVTFQEVSLDLLRLDPEDERPVVGFIRALCDRRRPDLVVPSGSPAIRFWMKNRAAILPDVPVLHVGADGRHLRSVPQAPGVGYVGFDLDVGAMIENILSLRPETSEIFVVLGESPVERYWRAELGRAWKPFERRVRITFLDGFSFPRILARAASLPKRSALLFTLLVVDGEGVPWEQESAIEKLRKVTNAPVFGWNDGQLGNGVVGGRLVDLGEIARTAARTADRILAGEQPPEATRELLPMSRLAFDDRELRRWGIDRGRLPPGSEILFREPTLLEKYRWHLVALLVVIAGQGLAIAGLLVARRRRLLAEGEARHLRQDLGHAGRVSAMGQLASSIAHELAQPLGAIQRNAEAAEVLLAHDPPDLAEVASIVGDIRRDDQRAGDVIEGMKALLRRGEPQKAVLPVASIVEGVALLVGPDARSRHVRLAVELEPGLPPVEGNKVQLQQVLVNLLLNAMEAMEGVPPEERRVLLRARLAAAGWVELSVTDTGPGIPPESAAGVFEPYVTTKPAGMGMGLAISRSIVETHGGTISVDAGPSPAPGATIRVLLPAGEVS